MENHFHIVMETPNPTLVAGMKWFLGTYTQRYNSRHRVRGHLFSGRYESLLVNSSDDFYLRTVCDYMHLNPIRAGLVKKAMSWRVMVGAVMGNICERRERGSHG